MLDYEWGNPSPIMLNGSDDDDQTNQPDQTRPVFDLYPQPFNEPLMNQTGFNPQTHHFHSPEPQTHFGSLYDPRAYGACYPPPPHPAMISFEPVGPTGFMVVPKSEPAGSDFASRIGLNLGGRTYFSSSEDDFVNRLYRQPRPLEAGSVNSPRCQAQGCNADLTHSKHYHRRHKVCEFHSKASTVIAAGLTQRFCQQCSRFHVLSEFDNGKRSCRKRLADHNRRRRKSQQPNHQDINKSSSSDTLPRSRQESGAQALSLVTVAVSPSRISLDYFGQRSYQSATISSASTSSLFFSN